MKVTSFKEVETYIYSSVITKLKNINIEEFAYGSPISSVDGYWTFRVRREPPQRDYRRQYQREQARERANFQVLLNSVKQEHVVVVYNPRSKLVRLYEQPFKQLKAMPLLGKLHEAFYTNTPFGKIITEESSYQNGTRGGYSEMREPLSSPTPERYEVERPTFSTDLSFSDHSGTVATINPYYSNINASDAVLEIMREELANIPQDWGRDEPA